MTLRVRSLLQAAVLLLAGSQGLHHLRYLLAPEHEAGLTLHGHGHGETHLFATGPAIGLLLALLLAMLVVKVAGAPRTTAPRAVRVRRLWPLVVAALLVIYGSQELLEGMLGHGHEGGFAALFEDGGWVALPIAGLLGALIALAVRVARAAEAFVFNPHVEIVLRLAAPVTTFVRIAVARPPRLPFSLAGAGRGPPVVA
jgi:hypothetical protein